MVEVRTMRTSTMILVLVLATTLLLAGPVSAHQGDGTEHSHEDGLYTGFGTLPLIGMAIFVYWALALPIALLIYTDASERRLNGARWAGILLVPFVGLFALAAYLMAQRGHPRVDIHDPWADGDRIVDSRRSLNGGPVGPA
jgi:hypothetical protein